MLIFSIVVDLPEDFEYDIYSFSFFRFKHRIIITNISVTMIRTEITKMPATTPDITWTFLPSLLLAFSLPLSSGGKYGKKAFNEMHAPNRHFTNLEV